MKTPLLRKRKEQTMNHNLTLLCASIQKDGVGDYCTTLQQALSHTGTTASVQTYQDFLANKKNAAGIISWQIVPYSYQKKGMMWPAARNICKELSAHPTHLMFHELWIGGIKASPLKNKFIGFFQKYGVDKVIKTTRPKLITTSNAFYQSSLASIGVEAALLPIFSNMPLGAKENNRLYQQVPADVLAHRDDYVIGIFFGTLHVRPDLKTQLVQLNQHIKKAGKKLFILHIGKCNAAEYFFNGFTAETGIGTRLFGVQDAADIAGLFRQADIGLSSYPKILFEKSGSIAALLHNDLPVVLLDKGFLPDNRQFDFIKEVSEIQDITTFINQQKTFGHRFGVSYIAEKYNTLLSSTFNK